MTTPEAGAPDALKLALRDGLAPCLRAEGFKGSGTTWVSQTTLGDAAIVNVQSSSSSNRTEVLCVVNLAIAPDPWLDWRSVQLGKPRSKSLKEHDGLWRQRMYPTVSARVRGSEEWWAVRDTQSAELAVHDMVEGLRTSALPRLRELLTRQGLIASVREGDLGLIKSTSAGGFFTRALALLLADQGPSDELSSLLGGFYAEQDERLRAYDEKFLPWIEARLESSSRT